MFFWGGYSFNVPQQQEHPDKPALKYPVYLPPAPGYLLQQQRQQQRHHVNAPLQLNEDELLAAVLNSRLRIRDIACGLKHAVIIMDQDAGSGAGGEADNKANADAAGVAVYGLGSNHSGQLGHRVATYTNTLVDLNATHEAFAGDIVSVACGLRHTLLATSSGCVYVSGDNTYGQLGLDPSTLASYYKSNGRIGGGGGDTSLASGTGGGSGKQSGEGGGVGGSKAGERHGVSHFTQVRALVHIRKVVASHNASFAIDDKGNVFSWGDAQYGHLGHGGDHIVPDEKGGLDRVENVRVPRMIRWFERHRVSIGDVAAGRGHVLFMSKDGEDVYTCGEGYFGKLGHGSIDSEFEPRRIESFPERKQKERVVSIAAGDDCSLVLKSNPLMGSVVYYFGKLTNGDGQLTPTIIPVNYTNLPKPSPLAFAPPPQQQQQGKTAKDGATDLQSSSNPNPNLYSEVTNNTVTLRSVKCGRGNQCLALSEDGRLFVWGKHPYTQLANGTNADAVKSKPTVVTALEKYVIAGATAGGTLMMAWGPSLRGPAAGADIKEEEEMGEESRKSAGHSQGADREVSKQDEQQHQPRQGDATDGHAWDVVVPHDDRVNARASARTGTDGDEEEVYEEGVRTFLTQFFGPGYAALAQRYIAGIPAAPPRTQRQRYSYAKIPVAELTVGQKVRLWMTNLYALGTITKVDASDRDNLPALPSNAAAAPDGAGNVTHSQRSQSRSQSLSQTPVRAPMLLSSQHHQQQSGSLLSQAHHHHVTGMTESLSEDAGGEGANSQDTKDAEVPKGRRVLVEWERDDWRDEVVTLFSDDETLDEANENRWQPFWFEKNEEGDYVIAKSR